jgi:hypothetical protein
MMRIPPDYETGGRVDSQLRGPVRTAKAAMKRIEPSVNDMTNFLGLSATD